MYYQLYLLLGFSYQVFAEVILAPQWSEFCPPSFLTVPSTVKTKDKKYWYERRVQYESSLARCNGYAGEDLKDCYAQVREAEYNKNKVWDMKMQKEYESLEYYREMNRQSQQYNLIRDVVNTISK